MDHRQSVRLALVGLSGAGKSTLGPILAKNLACPFHDLDRGIVAAQGRSVSAIFSAEGEPGFRGYETAELIRVTATPAPLVLATGGGVVLAPANRQLLRDEYHVIWLRVDPAEASRRLAETSDRPLVTPGDAEADLRRLLSAREDMYVEVADTMFDTDAATSPAQAVETLLRVLREQGNVI